MSAQVKEALQALIKTRKEIAPAIRNRHFLGGIHTRSYLPDGEDCYSLVCHLENRLDLLIDVLQERLTKEKK